MHPSQLPDYAKPLIADAIRRTPLPDGEKPTVFEVEQMVRAGEARLWLGQNSAAITDVLTELTLTTAHRAGLAGGNLEELLTMCAKAEILGRRFGLDQMVIEQARPGWERVLAPYGYKKEMRLVKEL